MEEEYWLKYGFKENGEVACVRLLSDKKPDEDFYYTEDGSYKEARNSHVIKLTPDVLEQLNSIREEKK
jgi:hypothetical protein